MSGSSVVTILNNLKGFLEAEVCSIIELQKADSDNVDNFEVMTPNAFIGWLPPGNFLPEGALPAIPCVVIGLDETEDDGDYFSLPIRISFAVYSPGLKDSNSSLVPDFDGYIDLWNFMDRARAVLRQNPFIEGCGSVEKTIKMKMYDEQPYPYWYGYISITIQTEGYPNPSIEKFLE